MGSSLSLSSKYKADNSKLIPAVASPANPSIDQTDSAKDQDDDYVEVTLLAKKLGTTENTIELKQLLVSCS